MSSRRILGLKVSTPAIISRPMRFGDELGYEDRQTLRSVVRKVHRNYFRDPPTDVQCDQLIDSLGPEAQRKILMVKIKADGSL